MTTADAERARALSTLVEVQREARHATSLQRFAFVAANRTHDVLPYRFAALWVARRGGELAAVSGVPWPEPNAPFTQWLERALRDADSRADGPEPVRLGPDSVSESVATDWADWAPPHALWLPLHAPGDGPCLGGLWLVRDEPWRDADLVFAQRLADGYGESLARLLGRRARRRGRRRWWWAAAAGAAVVAALFLIRVPLSVLAPAEIAPRDAVTITAPRKGVIDTLAVDPNDRVEKGDLLFTLKDTELRSRLRIKRRTLSVARARRQQAAQAAFGSEKSKARLAILRAEMEKARAEVKHLESLVDRSRVTAPRDGVVLFDSVDEWRGKPVKVGRRVMVVADPDAVLVEARVPVADAGVITPGAAVDMFLNTAPADPVPARVVSAAYQAQPTPQGAVAYRVRARLAETAGDPPRLGLKGTARIYGEPVSLAYLLLRRPLAALRQMAGV